MVAPDTSSDQQCLCTTRSLAGEQLSHHVTASLLKVYRELRAQGGVGKVGISNHLLSAN